MKFGHNMLYLNLTFLTIFLINIVWLCRADSAFEDNSILDLLQQFENLPLPKKYEFSDEEMQRNTKAYLSGLDNEDIFLNGTQLIQKYGYKVEVHRTITSDGYVLPMYRIPGDGPVTFLMHGLLSSFEDWLTIGPEKCLPFILANAGRDVWMGNARCNSFAKENVKISSSDSEYCNNSWDEIGRLDLPAMIDYVLETTGQDNLTYIGHSQGTTAFFVMCSELLDYDKKINFMVALSAVAWMKHVISPLIRIASPFNNLLLLGKALGISTVPPRNVTKAVSLALCGNSFLASIICSNANFVLCGFDYPQIDYERVPVIFNHNPSESSLKQLQHYGQLVVSGGFKRYNYGYFLNLEKYGSPTPPSYPVEKITVPIAIFYSPGDWFANPIDVQTLYEKLPNVVYYYQMPLPTFNHNDYLFAKDVKTLLYDVVLKYLEERVPFKTESTD
ncbi:lipase 3-like [Epargyreus clarus]|uniref:lipase 3-like n=1 Tax=Epargyreus clarus TaxID=520877 RepID=UPI003C3003C0